MILTVSEICDPDKVDLSIAKLYKLNVVELYKKFKPGKPTNIVSSVVVEQQALSLFKVSCSMIGAYTNFEQN